MRSHNAKASSASGAPLWYPLAAELPESAPVTAKRLLDMNMRMTQALAASLDLPALLHHAGLKAQKQQINDFLGCACRKRLKASKELLLKIPTPNFAIGVTIATGVCSQADGIGNGRAAATLLTESGAQVVCTDINLKWAEKTVSMIAEEFGENKAVAVQAYVMQGQGCKHSVDTTLDKFGRLNMLVDNGGGRNELAEIRGRGAIVDIASVAGLIGGTPILLYPTSKGAIVNMTRAMAAHHAPSDIQVNCVYPGMLHTPMLYSHGMAPEVRESHRMRGLLQAEGNGWDCGLAVRFLASDESR
ncbi:hypothetical protein BDQ12DRAFT_730210 [Crucibulum laeve]|uniref:NAD(P)-binding protein n=1 Tax=Crucibulum laeve TaxID=68775 RepID=A0A5C3MHG3_9AGAR|nr:hypothetical protein BDQ12DRAFT_730210 [Crucibulum laeve]